MSEEADSGDGRSYGNSIGIVDEDGGHSLPSEFPGAPCPEPLMTETNCRPRSRYRMVLTHEQEASQQAAAAAKEGLTGVGGFDSVGGGVSGSGDDDIGNYKCMESDSEVVSLSRETGHGAFAGICAEDVGGGVLLMQRAEDAEFGGEVKAASAPIRAPATEDYLSGEALGTEMGKRKDFSMKVSRRVSRVGAGGECRFDELSNRVCLCNV